MKGSDLRRVEWTRRDFMISMLATGFAVAADPVEANAINTDVGGLTAGEVQVRAADRSIPAYHAMPERGGPFPIVLVVQEIFGVHEHIRDICRRLAKAGYLAVAPELYVRQGDVSRLTDIQQIFKDVVSKVPDAQVMSDLDATLDWARAANQGDAARAGITGFCWGGRITWLYAAHNPKLKAGVAWYGRLVGDVSAMQPRHPADIAAQLTVPVLGLYGGADTGIPLDSVDKMRAALANGRSASQIHVYPDTPHAFFADYRPSYRKDAAEDGWRRLQEWFAGHGLAADGAAAPNH